MTTQQQPDPPVVLAAEQPGDGEPMRLKIMTQQPESLLLTIEQTAALLCYHRNTIHEMIRRGELKTVGRYKRRRVIRASVDRWIKQQSQ